MNLLYTDYSTDYKKVDKSGINEILERVRDLSLTELISLAETVFPMITTDMSNSDIIGYITDFFPILLELEVITQSAPQDGEYKSAMISGMSVLVPDLEKINARLKETIGY